MNKAEHSF